MRHWRFKDYHPKNSGSHLQEWYERQDDEVRAEFDLSMIILSENEEWSEKTDCVPLSGEYLGLYELVIDVTLDDRFVQVRPIGIFQPDSPVFIILICSEKDIGGYNPPLAKALEYKKAWERQEGEIYDYNSI